MFRYLTAHWRPTLAVATVAVLTGGAVTAHAAGAPLPANPFGTSHVGTAADSSRILLPDNQWIQPAGQRTTLTAECVGEALSPDGAHLAVQEGGSASGAKNVVILDAATGSVVQTFGGSGTAAPAYSPDGTALYTASYGSIAKYAVGADGTVTNPTAPLVITLPKGQFSAKNGNVDSGNAPAGSALPMGFAFSADGATLYAAESGSNQLAVIDTASGKITAQLPAGNVPNDIVVAGDKAYVSDRGGDSATIGQFSDATGGTQIAASPYTGAATTGTVSVIDLSTGTLAKTITVGLQPAAMTLHDGALFVANTNSDSVSVIDTGSDTVVQTFNVEPLPGSTVGASPNSIAFDGGALLVSVGGDNAIAEFRYTDPRTPVAYQGLIPTDWYPNGLLYDQQAGTILVSNQHGIGTDGADQTYLEKGSITSFGLPSNGDLGTFTSQVFANNGWNTISSQNARPDVAPVAIPQRLGEPSTIKHVFLIVRENRTYDQLFGDIGKGDSDPAYANYGATYTPNAHKVVDQFSLFDNFYDSGMLSADGHNWIVQADANDYMQQNAATAWARSYPSLGGDSLAYQRDGFIWDAAEAAGKTVQNFGEHEEFLSGSLGSWQQYYADSQIMENKATGTLPVAQDAVQWRSDSPSLTNISVPDYPTFNLNIPDQYRADVWEQSFEKAEKTGNLANLSIIYLPNDHTGGTPSAGAQVADNDLATGRVIDDISHSPFWKSSAVFVMEDDSQAGNDHVDGHRAPLMIASPYVKHGAVDSTYYSQVNVIKTIEQILDIQPMNQMDRAAEPMFDAFTDRADPATYNVVPNQVSLTQNVTGLLRVSPITAVPATPPPTSPAATDDTSVPTDEQGTADAWTRWYRTEAEPKLTGPHASPDATNPAQLNRYDWYTSTHWARPYPGDATILTPDQVPGRNLPTDFLGD